MPVKYTRDLLTTLAAESTSVNDMIRRLGVPLAGGTHGYLSRRLKHYGIDTSHFTGHCQAAGELAKDELRTAVASHRSVIGVVRAMGLTETNASRRLVRRGIATHRLDTSHFTGSAHNRGRRNNGSEPERLLIRRAPGSQRVPGGRLRVALLRIGRSDSCEMCGIPPVWRGFPLTLEVDHINGDWLDNRAENLRLLCPNCHSVTPTYCGRNRRHPSAP